MIQPSMLQPSPAPAASPEAADLRSPRSDDHGSFRAELDRRRWQSAPAEDTPAERETTAREEAPATSAPRESSRSDSDSPPPTSETPAASAETNAPETVETNAGNTTTGGEEGRSETTGPATPGAQATPESAPPVQLAANPAPQPVVLPTQLAAPIPVNADGANGTNAGPTTETESASRPPTVTPTATATAASSAIAATNASAVAAESATATESPSTTSPGSAIESGSAPATATDPATGSATATASASTTTTATASASTTTTASATASATTTATATATVPVPVPVPVPTTAAPEPNRSRRPAPASPSTPTANPTPTEPANATSPATAEPTLPENIRELTEFRATTPVQESTTNERDGVPRPAPALARAVQVDTGIRLEHAAQQLHAAADARVVAPTSPTTTVAPAASLTPQVVDELLTTDPSRVDDARVTGRVVRGLATMINQRGGVMTMRLSPPELGDLRVQMTITQGSVTAQFTAATEHAQNLLSRNMASLRASLESHGLNVERLGVQVAPAESNGSTRAGDGDGQSGSRQDAEHDAAGRESQGRRDQDDLDGQNYRTGRMWGAASRANAAQAGAFPELLSIGGDA